MPITTQTLYRHWFHQLMALGIGLSLGLSNLAMASDKAPRYEDPEITVYNQNFGLVKDNRKVTLSRGINTLALDDVAALIDPTSVHLKSKAGDVSVLEQNFKYDLIERSNILNRLVGHKIKFRHENTVKEGILLNPANTVMRQQGGSNNYYGGGYNTQSNSEFAVQTTEGVLLTALHDVLIDTLPEGLFPKPTLMWLLQSKENGDIPVEVSYITDGLNWSCDYVLTLSQKDDVADLTGWVSLINQSGTSYPNAHLKLVAGDVRKLQNEGNVYPMAAAMEYRKMDAVGNGRQFEEESFFEYHLYTLQRPTTIADRETKQVSLVQGSEIPLKKTFIFDPERQQYLGWSRNGYSSGYYGSFDYYYNRPGSGSDTYPDKKVNTLIAFENKKAHHLGLPLPKGKIRVYKEDRSGALQFVGEDQVDHTPEDEKIELYLGDAFDLVGEKKRMNYRKTQDWVEETYEIVLKNHKAETVTVQAVEHLFGDWSITAKTHPYSRQDAHTIVFPITVPAKGETLLTYTVHIKRN